MKPKPPASRPFKDARETVWISYESKTETSRPSAPSTSLFDDRIPRSLGAASGILAVASIGLALLAWLTGRLADPLTAALAASAAVQGLVGGILAFVASRSASLLGLRLSKVHERSKKLRFSKEELEEVNRVKTDFFNNVSHEFRTPITLTLGPLQGLLGGRYGTVSEAARRQLKLMAAQQQRLLQLINQILDAAKLEAGLAVLKASPVADFNVFVSSRVEQFRSLSEEKGLDLKIDLDPRVKGREILVDPEKFDKILFNLLSNAHKFTQHGSIEVSTSLRDGSVAVRVKDSGVGIRADQIPAVFDRFRQAEGSVSKDYAGTGLGLSLVRDYARLHGGEALVTSEYGRGATFEVALPLGRDHLDPASIVPSEEASPDEAGMARQAKTAALASGADPQGDSTVEALNEAATAELAADKPVVLYVDDHAELRKYVHGLLQPAYNVFLAVNGRDGLEKAARHSPDLILSDLMMPEMDGLDFLKNIRQDPGLRALPFILLTARAELDARVSGLESGADDYLSKPFSEAEILARVKNLVALRSQQVRLKRELQAARGIQQALLPKPLATDRFTADYLYLPSEELSGDFCDLLVAGDWLFAYVADVTSHGTASAQVTYLLKELFRTALRENPQNPLPDLIAGVGARYAEHGLDYDVALQVARLHVPTRVLETVRAAAPSPLRVSAAGLPEVLSVSPGPALSARVRKEAGSYPVLKTALEAGDRVFFFTDGCYEFSPGEFGLRPFHRLLSDLSIDLPAERGPGTWTETVLAALKQIRREGAFPDDLTIVRLQV